VLMGWFILGEMGDLYFHGWLVIMGSAKGCRCVLLVALWVVQHAGLGLSGGCWM